MFKKTNIWEFQIFLNSLFGKAKVTASNVSTKVEDLTGNTVEKVTEATGK